MYNSNVLSSLSNPVFLLVIGFLVFMVVLTPLEILTEKLLKRFILSAKDDLLVKIVYVIEDIILALLTNILLIKTVSLKIINPADPYFINYILTFYIPFFGLWLMRFLMFSLFKRNTGYIRYFARLYFLGVNILFALIFLAFTINFFAGTFK